MQFRKRATLFRQFKTKEKPAEAGQVAVPKGDWRRRQVFREALTGGASVPADNLRRQLKNELRRHIRQCLSCPLGDRRCSKNELAFNQRKQKIPAAGARVFQGECADTKDIEAFKACRDPRRVPLMAKGESYKEPVALAR